MGKRARTGTAWLVSAAIHLILVLFTLPDGGDLAGRNMEILEVGLVEMTRGTREVFTAPSPEVPPASNMPAPNPPIKPVTPVQTKPGQETRPPIQPARPEPATAQQNPAGPSGDSAPAPSKNTTETALSGSGPAVGYGTGEGYVLNRPVSYPKNAQNDGTEGRVLLMVFLSPNGGVKAGMVESSGDARLDSYAVRAVTEAWKYSTPPTALRIRVALDFRNGQVHVAFLGAEPWDERGGM